ncbi:MAG TPA: hypothetical protein VEW27_00720 [Methylomirabilota bacterium]|nr:hypothetical protein [Methylomirabilota bacterium]
MLIIGQSAMPDKRIVAFGWLTGGNSSREPTANERSASARFEMVRLAGIEPAKLGLVS